MSTLGAKDDGNFWMLFKDFFQFFYSITISYTNDKFFHTRIADQIEDEEWGVSRLTLPKDTETAFLSVYQMNMKFFDPEEDGDDANQDVIAQQELDKKDTLATMLVKQLATDKAVEN